MGTRALFAAKIDIMSKIIPRIIPNIIFMMAMTSSIMASMNAVIMLSLVRPLPFAAARACIPQQAGLTKLGPSPNGGGSIMTIMIGGTKTIRHWILQTVAALAIQVRKRPVDVACCNNPSLLRLRVGIRMADANQMPKAAMIPIQNVRIMPMIIAMIARIIFIWWRQVHDER